MTGFADWIDQLDQMNDPDQRSARLRATIDALTRTSPAEVEAWQKRCRHLERQLDQLGTRNALAERALRALAPHTARLPRIVREAFNAWAAEHRRQTTGAA